MPERGPAPPLAAGPGAAWWLARHVPVKEIREASNHQRLHGSRALADELDYLSAQLRHIEDWHRAASACGTAEVVEAEIEARLESPSSVGSMEVAEWLRCSDRRVRQLIDREEFSATKVGGRWVIDRESVEDYLASRRST